MAKNKTPEIDLRLYLIGIGNAAMSDYTKIGSDYTKGFLAAITMIKNFLNGNSVSNERLTFVSKTKYRRKLSDKKMEFTKRKPLLDVLIEKKAKK